MIFYAYISHDMIQTGTIVFFCGLCQERNMISVDIIIAGDFCAIFGQILI